MRLSTKGRYGLKAIFELALNESSGPVPLKHIAQKRNISEQYLEQIFASLRKAGLVKSIRGAQGGYLLGRTPDKITVGDIIVVLEGPVAPSECVLDSENCSNSEECVTKVVWEKIKTSIEEVINSITLQDMIDDHMKNQNKDNFNYMI
jgi:Rrf2 family transcriptional regulator, cysteine metabolism repressor